MSHVAKTPEPPYYAVIFSNTLSDNTEGYADTAARMLELAALQDGFLGVESARDGLGITVSYWRDLDAIQSWKQDAEHTEARRLGRERWYSGFCTRIAKIERQYSFEKNAE